MKHNQTPQTDEPACTARRWPANFPRRILVVDDDNDSRQLTSDVLTGSGFAVQAVNDGAAAWDAVQANYYDLIITDNKMPRMTGLEMIGKLRAASMALPVIMATGQMPTQEFARRPWLRPDVALHKPYSNDDLVAAVREILSMDDGR